MLAERSAHRQPGTGSMTGTSRISMNGIKVPRSRRKMKKVAIKLAAASTRRNAPPTLPAAKLLSPSRFGGSWHCRKAGLSASSRSLSAAASCERGMGAKRGSRPRPYRGVACKDAFDCAHARESREGFDDDDSSGIDPLCAGRAGGGGRNRVARFHGFGVALVDRCCPSSIVSPPKEFRFARSTSTKNRNSPGNASASPAFPVL